MDLLLREEVREVNMLVDSLVIHNNPDPFNFINSMEAGSADPVLPNLFKKYSAGKHYYDEYQRDFDSAMQYADSTLQLFNNEENIAEYRMYYLHAILLKEDILRRKHLYGTSIQYLLQGWQMIDPGATPCIASQYLGRLGTVSYLQDAFPEAQNYYTRAWNTSSMCEEKVSFSYYRIKFQYLQNIASTHSQLAKPDSALYYINQSLDVIDNEMEETAESENEHRFIDVARGVAFGNKASEMAKLGVENEPESLWKESIRINLQRGFANEHAQLMRIHLADYYITSDRMDEAKALLNVVETWLNSNSSETAQRRWLNVYSHWLEESGDYRQAYSVYRQYVELENTLQEARTNLAALDLANQIQLLENQHNLERLQIESSQRNVYLLFALLIALMVIVILFLVWKNWKESQRNVLRLSNLNYVITKKNDQLEETNRAISKIMSIVSHDLRSPLAGVREIAAVMMDDATLEKKQRNWARVIRNTTNQSLKLMKEILNLDLHHKSNNGSALQAIRKKPVGIRSFLEDCVALLQIQANEKNQSIHLNSATDVKIQMDLDGMTRVINNVVGNAIKFSSENSSIHVKAKEELKTVLISVKDQGMGIPDQNEEDIFDMNSGLKRKGTNNEESYGLGLSIAKEIVEDHDGNIWFESSESIGTTFFIELPSNQGNNKINSESEI